MYSIGLKNIPFLPEPNQVIYVENIFDDKVNSFIKNNYYELELEFRKVDLEFVYLPLYCNMAKVKEKVQYYAPYLVSQINTPDTLNSSYLLDFMSRPENRIKIPPSLLFSPKQCVDEWRFRGISLNDIVSDNIEVLDIVDLVCDEIYLANHPVEFHIARSYDDEAHHSAKVEESECAYAPMEKKKSSQQSLFSILGAYIPKKTDKDSEDEDILFRMGDEEDKSNVSDEEPSILFREVRKFVESAISDDEDEYDSEPSEEITRMLENLQTTVQRLRLKGVALGAIHEFIDKQEPVSPLVITEDLRLFLPLYNNIEIELSAQKKAFYFLFLNHPEGIVLQHLEDYHNELMNYYKQTKKGTITQKMEESIRHLEAYGNNQIHVIIARIREAFCMKFDERLARNYFISGEKGEPYKIPLAPEYVKWEE